MKFRLSRLLLPALLLACALQASADSIGPVTLGITNNPCQGSTCVPTLTNIATVTVTQLNSTQVQFVVMALPGYSIQIQSNKFFDFNTNIVPLSALSLDGGVVTAFGNGGSTNVKASVLTDVQGQAGTGEFDLGLNDLGNPPKINNATVTGASEIKFTIDLGTGANSTTLTAADLFQTNADGWHYEMHFCDGNGPSCTAPTGFVVDTGMPTIPTPEPSSIVFLSTGVAGLIATKRRW